MQCEPFQGTTVKQTTSYFHLDRYRHRCRYRNVITALLRKWIALAALILQQCYTTCGKVASTLLVKSANLTTLVWPKKRTLEKSQLKTSKQTRCFILVLMILYIKSFSTFAKYNLPHNVLNIMIPFLSCILLYCLFHIPHENFTAWNTMDDIFSRAFISFATEIKW